MAMAAPFPSYLDALIESFPPALRAATLHQHKYTEDHQNVGEFIEKLFGRLSDLLFHIDKQINKVLLQGRFLPKKVNQWAMEARALKCQVSDLMKKQQNTKSDSLNCEELVEVGIEMINHLKKCPCKDEMMYYKPVPVVIQRRELGPDKSDPYLEGTKAERTPWKKEQTVDPVEGHILEDEDGTKIQPSPGTSLVLVEPQNKNDIAPPVEKLEIRAGEASRREIVSTTEFVLEDPHYLVSVKDDRIKLEMDKQTILIENCSPVNPVLNLVEQDLRELAEKPNYDNSLVLFLQRNYRLTLIHSSFFDTMPELRFLDLSDTRISILPSSLFRLSKLKVLMLRNCVCLEKLPSEIGNLNQMEVFDLSGIELYNLPDEIARLTLLKHMQISFYGPDDESEFDHLPSQLVSPSFLSELKEVQALSITVHPNDHRWTAVVACIIEDVGKLEMLSYLQFYFPEVETFEEFIRMSPSWNKNVLKKFSFIIGHNVKRIVSRVPHKVESLFDQHDRRLRFVNGDKVTQWIKTALKQVGAFYLDHHIEIQSLSEFGVSNLQALKFCIVRECPKIQAILEGKTTEGAFPCLEHLGIYYLWELKHIWKPPSPPRRLKRIWKTPEPSGNFKGLRNLIVNTCPKLQFVLSESMLRCLPNLEELVVEDCERVEKIIKEERKKVKYLDDVMLPGLRKLVLHYLPELVSLGNGLCLSPEKVDVHGCPKFSLKSGLV